MSIEDNIRRLAAGEMDELVLRSAHRGWQCLVKRRGRLGGPWGVGYDPDPAVALRQGIDAFNAETDAMTEGAFG